MTRALASSELDVKEFAIVADFVGYKAKLLMRIGSAGEVCITHPRVDRE